MEDIPGVEKVELHPKESSSKTTHCHLHATYNIFAHYPSPASLRPHKTFKNEHLIKHLKTETSQNNTKQTFQLINDYIK
jgi:hypothetical protein